MIGHRLLSHEFDWLLVLHSGIKRFTCLPCDLEQVYDVIEQGEKGYCTRHLHHNIAPRNLERFHSNRQNNVFINPVLVIFVTEIAFLFMYMQIISVTSEGSKDLLQRNNVRKSHLPVINSFANTFIFYIV